MVLFDQVVQVLRAPDLRFLRHQAIGLHLTYRPVRGSVSIERDRLWRLALMFEAVVQIGINDSVRVSG